MPDPLYLLDVNVLVARVFEDHVHHEAAKEWLAADGLQWAICPFTEAGFLRYATAPGMGNLNAGEATSILEDLSRKSGFHYQPIAADWHTLSKPFFRRLHGYRQITDAYLLGLSIQEGLVLATFDKAMLHLAGEHRNHLLMLDPG